MRAWLALLLVLLASSAEAQAPKTTVRTKLDPAAGVVIGQPVNLMIDVLFTGEMGHPPRVTVPEVAGAQVMRFETQGITIRDIIDGKAAVGQEFTFVVMPRRGGSLAIPAAKIELLDRAGEVIGSAKGEMQTLTVTVPLGIDASSPVIASTSVTAKESWSPDPKAPLAAGGALVRTIERQATDVPALGMADFAFTAPEGIRVYVDPPVSDDRVNRGAVTGHRTDRVTYVFEKAGAYELPALAQQWWDLGDKAAKTARLPGLSVSVAPAEIPTVTREPVSAGPDRLRLGLQVACTMLALALLVLIGRLVTPRWREWRAAHEASEGWARKALGEAARRGDAPATYRAVSIWLSRLDGPGREAVRRDAALGPSIAALEKALFGNGTWSDEDGGRLEAAASEFEPPGLGEGYSRGTALPPLNPNIG